MSGNTATIVGNLTRDPELRFTASGKALVKGSVAHNHRFYKKGTDEFEEKSNFIDFTAWGQLAENIAESYGKGDRVILVGRLDFQSWETDDGDKRSKLELAVEASGPDLNWATASIARNPRSGEGGSRSGRQEPEYSEDPF